MIYRPTDITLIKGQRRWVPPFPLSFKVARWLQTKTLITSIVAI
jgi:hypothetical protein